MLTNKTFTKQLLTFLFLDVEDEAVLRFNTSATGIPLKLITYYFVKDLPVMTFQMTFKIRTSIRKKGSLASSAAGTNHLFACLWIV